MKFILRLLLSLSIIVSSCSFAASPQTIRFGTEATYPPFVSVDQNGKFQGFDVDVVNSLCTIMQAKCTITSQAWDSLIPSLQLGKFDAMFGGMNITAEREKQVDFTKPFYTNTASLVAPKSEHLNLSADSLKGKTIGVLSGTTFVSYLQEKYGSAVKVNTYASEQNAFLDLTAGRVDAVMGDTPVVEHWLKDRSDYEIIGAPITDEKYFGKGYAIAVRKGNKELVDALNKAIDTIQANGTLAQITQKYFGNN